MGTSLGGENTALIFGDSTTSPFLGFAPPRPLRVFYLQAEIQYHYLRERLKQITLAPAVIAAARTTFVATPKLKMLLDNEGSVRVAQAIGRAFPDAPVDIICIDPIRNLFDGGPDGGGENDNTAMMFFLKDRVEVLRDYIRRISRRFAKHSRPW